MVKQEKEKGTPFPFFEYKTDFCGDFFKGVFESNKDLYHV